MHCTPKSYYDLMVLLSLFHYGCGWISGESDTPLRKASAQMNFANPFVWKDLLNTGSFLTECPENRNFFYEYL
jgi:hypothetical protein